MIVNGRVASKDRQETAGIRAGALTLLCERFMHTIRLENVLRVFVACIVHR
jgi:hypothetical protein